MDRSAGFTLVELIMTMVIIGIISAVAIPRFFETSVFQDHGAANQVKAALRYGQKVAIAQRRTAGVAVTITADSTSNCGAELNATGNVDCVIRTGVAVDQTLPWTVNFYARGNPDGAASVVVGTTTINIEAETGYVH